MVNLDELIMMAWQREREDDSRMVRDFQLQHLANIRRALEPNSNGKIVKETFAIKILQKKMLHFEQLNIAKKERSLKAIFTIKISTRGMCYDLQVSIGSRNADSSQFTG